MRKFPLLGAALFIPALALCVSVSGCGKSEAPKPASPAPSGAPAPEAKKDDKQPTAVPAGAGAKITGPTDAVVKGVVKFDGSAPALVPNELIQKHADKDICLKGSDFEKSDQKWLVGKDGGVANVVVFLTGAGQFEVSPEIKKSFEQPAVIDQPHCAFVPHILAMYPGAGQKLEVKNSAPVPHNTRMSGDPLNNPGLPDKNLPPGSKEIVPIKYQGKKPIDVACSQHPWMNAKVFTFNNPYFAVTDENGAFEIKNVPSGVELVVNVWHETFNGGLEKAKEAEKKSFKTGVNEESLKVK